jgi:hypothetical protein
MKRACDYREKWESEEQERDRIWAAELSFGSL